LKDTENRLGQNPTDPRLLAAAGSYYLKINNRSAAEAVYQRFFATDCSDAMFLNIVVYEYADNGGTNLDRAYELAAKAQKLAEKSDPYQLSYINDTVAWIQLKRGYLREALNTLITVKSQNSWPPGAVEFHLGMAHYMLLEEDAASEAFQKVIQLQKGIRTETSEAEQARKCLAVLSLKVNLSSDSTAPTKLKDRLKEEPDDPVALKHLAEIYAADSARTNEVNDPLVLKALGIRAYHSEEWSNAVACLSRSMQTRANDAQLLFYLGMAQSQLGQRNESADSLRKAIVLGLKSAQIEEVNKMASAASPGNGTNSTRQ
jgi:Flp pilus assembly protein TadD